MYSTVLKVLFNRWVSYYLDLKGLKERNVVPEILVLNIY